MKGLIFLSAFCVAAFSPSLASASVKDEDLKRVFNEYGNGQYLDQSGYMTWAVGECGMSMPEAAAWFNATDANHDGLVSQQEFSDGRPSA